MLNVSAALRRSSVPLVSSLSISDSTSSPPVLGENSRFFRYLESSISLLKVFQYNKKSVGSMPAVLPYLYRSIAASIAPIHPNAQNIFISLF